MSEDEKLVEGIARRMADHGDWENYVHTAREVIARVRAYDAEQGLVTVPMSAQSEALGTGEAPMQRACSQWRRINGLAYPRTCALCQLGPCKYPPATPAPQSDGEAG